MTAATAKFFRLFMWRFACCVRGIGICSLCSARTYRHLLIPLMVSFALPSFFKFHKTFRILPSWLLGVGVQFILGGVLDVTRLICLVISVDYVVCWGTFSMGWFSISFHLLCSCLGFLLGMPLWILSGLCLWRGLLVEALVLRSWFASSLFISPFIWGVRKRFFLTQGTFLGRAFLEVRLYDVFVGGGKRRKDNMLFWWVPEGGHESEKLMSLAESRDALLLSGKKNPDFRIWERDRERAMSYVSFV